MKVKKFFCFLIVLIIASMGLFADSITVAVDTEETDYTPTQIENGSFETEPWMDYWIGSTKYTTSKQYCF